MSIVFCGETQVMQPNQDNRSTDAQLVAWLNRPGKIRESVGRLRMPARFIVTDDGEDPPDTEETLP